MSEFNAEVISKGRITIKGSVRKLLDIQDGDTVTVKIMGVFKSPKNKKKEGD